MQSRLAIAILAALVLVAPVSAQEMPAFTQAYQVRIGSGDIPTTTYHEGDGWNLAQSIQVKHIQGAATTVAFHPPAASTVLNTSCTCGPVAVTQGGASDIIAEISSQTASGTYRIETVSRAALPGVAAGMMWQLPAVQAANQIGEASAGLVVVYTPSGGAGLTVDSPMGPSGSLACANAAPCKINFWEASPSAPLPNPMWISVHPAAAAPAPPEAAGFPWFYVIGGVLVGVLLWSFLVSRGLVQKRTRKQVATEPAHQELARREPLPLLEARKRALLAALKEVEVAKMNKEMDDASYDAVKGELKQEAVAVMRAIEETPKS